MKVTVYKRPRGHQEVIDCANIRLEDAKWFEANGVKVSMEDMGHDIILYADIGRTVNNDPYEDPDEVIVFAGGKSCEDAMFMLRKQCEEEMRSPAPESKDE